MMMAAAILLCLLSLQANGLVTTDAKCLNGSSYSWMFNSIRQSPCDVAAALASVCIDRQFTLKPLSPGYVYSGPTKTNQNSCRCSSVFYSLLSGCAYCQGRNYHRWSNYIANCSTIYLTVYDQQIPVGVKVPAYAYQNVSISGTFDVIFAQSVNGVESSRLPPSSTSSSSVATSGSNNEGNKLVIIGGVAGGVGGLGLLVLISCILLHKQKRKHPDTAQISYISSPILLPHSSSPGSSEEFIDLSTHSPYTNRSVGRMKLG